MNISEILKYKSKGHTKALKGLNARYRISKNAMAKRHTGWKRAEEDFRGYTPESTEDTRRKAERNKGVLHYTTLTVPMTYAMALTAHTYWSSIFLSRTPIFQLATRKGNAEQGAIAMESILDYQIYGGNILVTLFLWLMDPAKYGFGVLSTYWDREVKRVGQLVETSVLDPITGVAIPGRTEVKKQTREIEGYQGNRAYNVRPYNFFPDPRMALVDFQKGEFCGDVTYKSFQSIISDSTYFNLDALKDIQGNRSGATRVEETGSEQIQLPVVEQDTSGQDNGDLSDKGVTSVLRIVANIIPKDWSLGEENLPEKWAFEVAGAGAEGDHKVIISAEPFGHIHDEYPYDLLFYEVDGYVLDIRGMMEIGKDLNTATSWELNSHMFNVRRAMNDQLVVDPSRIVMKDLLEGGPGKIIRMKPTAYGQDVRAAVSQLPVQDVTRQNIQDMQLISELMQRVLGTNDNVMGAVTPGGRKTATEIRTASTFSMSRLKTVAEYFSATGFSSLARKMVSNTQQFYFLDKPEGFQEAFSIVGDMVEGLQSTQVTPESIAGNYDFVPVDGTLPVDRTAQAGLWKELILGLAQTGLISGYDIDGMLNWTASLTGIRSLKRFKIQPMGDEALRQQVKEGNFVPVPRPGNGS